MRLIRNKKEYPANPHECLIVLHDSVAASDRIGRSQRQIKEKNVVHNDKKCVFSVKKQYKNDAENISKRLG